MFSKDSPLQQLPTLPPPLPEPEIDPARLDPDALKVLARLKRHGFTAYLVGGCVRDLLLGVTPTDFDVATDATPEEIRALFRNSRLIGRRFRLAHVIFGPDRIIEVATFRGDPLAQSEVPEDHGEEEDEAEETNGSEHANGSGDLDDGFGDARARRPAGTTRSLRAADRRRDNGDRSRARESRGSGADLLVTDDNQFGTAEEDALRRDFTVNGLFYEIEEGRVIDYVGGREDLERRVVRTIGDPDVRMQEDPVRSMRAARIAAKLDLTIDPATFAAMRRHAAELPRCAPARVLEEILKILRTGASLPAFQLLREAGVLKVLLPSIERVLVLGGGETEAAFHSRLGALDELISEGLRPSDAVLLATLLSILPLQDASRERGHLSHQDALFAFLAQDGAESPRRSRSRDAVDASGLPLPSADRVLAGMSAQARLPRRIADRVRLILATQRVLRQPRKKRSRRRSAGPVAAPHFPEALVLLEIMVRATGTDADILERWKARAEQYAITKARREQARFEKPEEEEGRRSSRGRSPKRDGASRSTSGKEARSDAEASPDSVPALKQRGDSKPRRPARRRRKGKDPGNGEKSAAQPNPTTGEEKTETRSTPSTSKKPRATSRARAASSKSRATTTPNGVTSSPSPRAQESSGPEAEAADSPKPQKKRRRSGRGRRAVAAALTEAPEHEGQG